jgi:bidirectional [NiFe] hydrogenase diaphorase subunit
VADKISIRIDGELVAAAKGQTILDAARANSKYIPTLCFLENITSVGACRLCIVEVSGMNRLVPACTTPVQDGMSVTTQSETLKHYRKMTLEFLFAERNHVCAVCVSNNHCELQDMAQRLGVTHVRYPYSFPKLTVDLSHPRFVLDHNRCILCSRCVRVCAEVEGARVWDIGARGLGSMLVADLAGPWGQAKGCTSCGKCVQVCPTGALAEKGLAVEEMVKQESKVTRLAAHRGGRQ